MDDFTILSYPGARDSSLLSLNEKRSKYMLPFGGRFRVVDFTIRNSIDSGARRTIIFNNCEDDLAAYVEHYGPFKGKHQSPIRVISRSRTDIRFCHNLVTESNTRYYVIYNGDNPSIIDFREMIERYKKKRSPAMLFTLKHTGKASMAYTMLVADRKSLLSAIDSAVEEERHAPNLFEMIINMMINRGIRREAMSAHYWPIRSIPDYYLFNMGVMEHKELFSFMYGGSSLRGFIRGEGFAVVGPEARIVRSYISDSCKINGSVQNSIIFPCVEIGERAVIKDSIILPYNRIGAGARITRTVIDESSPVAGGDPRTQDAPSPPPLHIGDRCYIGSDDQQLKNSDFPRSIYGSITLIGKDCEIPEASRIGGACYVASGRGREYFSKSKYLYDGTSLVK